MKDAGIGQAAKVLTLINQKRIPHDQLQALLDGGWLSDLLEANLDAMDRNEFRKLCGLKLGFESVMITPHMDLHGALAISRHHYDYVNPDIEKRFIAAWYTHKLWKHWPSYVPGRPTEVFLVRMKKGVVSRKVVEERIAKDGMRPILLPELLALGSEHPELHRKFHIACLGTLDEYDGAVHAPCIFGYPDQLRLGIDENSDWFDGNFVFGAVKK
jgi:hypothetical protein